jgi:aryl-alcohol dehydrogenase-like predicted oxidoreductase
VAKRRDAVTAAPLVFGPLVSGPLVFGGAPIGGLFAPVSDEAAAGTLAAAWDAGIRTFDTAPHYGVGVSERRLGSFLAGRPRDEYSVCTKVGRRLVPAAELRAQGAVRAVGVGMNSPAPLAWLVERCDLDCVLVAGRYTLLDDSAAAGLFPLCQRRGVAVLAGGVFNSGILAGPGDGATYDYAPAPPALLARARRMRDACASYAVPLAAAALQFTLRHSAVTAAVVGARSAEEITADTSYLSTPIPDALWAELEALSHDHEGSLVRRD